MDEYFHITFTRIIDSKGNDIVKFKFGGYHNDNIFSNEYFETNYEEYVKLFVPDKNIYYDYSYGF